ncbi:MAG: 2-dehydropantoate 2-reductase N-terminal domain-containing protein [Cyanobacteria bacterium P01_A01_bin.123]
MRICVIGTGYVGLVTGASLAHIGHNVICVDNNATKVKAYDPIDINNGHPSIPDAVKLCQTPKQLAADSDVLVAVTD